MGWGQSIARCWREAPRPVGGAATGEVPRHGLAPLTASGCVFMHPGPLRQHPIMPPVGRRCGPCEGKAWALCVTGGRLFLHPPSSDRADERVFRTRHLCVVSRCHSRPRLTDRDGAAARPSALGRRPAGPVRPSRRARCDRDGAADRGRVGGAGRLPTVEPLSPPRGCSTASCDARRRTSNRAVGSASRSRTAPRTGGGNWGAHSHGFRGLRDDQLPPACETLEQTLALP
jgi:hypothetical protein